MPKEIKVYSTPTCPWCKKLKEYLNEKSIVYQDLDVSVDKRALNEMIHKSGQIGVPQIEINGKIIIGFDRSAIEKEL